MNVTRDQFAAVLAKHGVIHPAALYNSENYDGGAMLKWVLTAYDELNADSPAIAAAREALREEIRCEVSKLYWYWDEEKLTRLRAALARLEGVQPAPACSEPDRVSIDRNALKVLCMCAAALCRKSNDERIEATRRALKRVENDQWPNAAQTGAGLESEPASHVETIRCPSCRKVQQARVRHTEPFRAYVHTCECGYTITESEWERMENVSSTEQEPA